MKHLIFLTALVRYGYTSEQLIEIDSTKVVPSLNGSKKHHTLKLLPIIPKLKSTHSESISKHVQKIKEKSKHLKHHNEIINFVNKFIDEPKISIQKFKNKFKQVHTTDIPKHIEEIANVGHSIISNTVKSVRREADFGKIHIKPEVITHVIKNVVDLHKLVFPVNGYIEKLTSEMEHMQHEVQEINPFWNDIKPHFDHASKSIDVISNGFTIISDYASAIVNSHMGENVGSSNLGKHNDIHSLWDPIIKIATTFLNIGKTAHSLGRDFNQLKLLLKKT